MILDLDGAALARAIHVASVVHWIGGVWFVTFVVLPAVARFAEPERAVALFEAVEHRFAGQARLSTLAAAASGFWMTGVWSAWDRFLDPRFFWMHAMVALWAVFTVVLFVAEPLFLHAWFERRARLAPEATMRLVLRLHRVLSTLALIVVAVAALGAHGGL
ncbi:MAG: hypothetical protein LWW93_07520 [Hyphomicrobiales bacterium]|nr:hypothetical protein [Hyphomicrobiales bacterium]